MKQGKILVVDGLNYGNAVEGLGEVVTDEADFYANPEQYRLVLFTGGADVSPSLYNDVSPEGRCFTNAGRDAHEQKIFDYALKHSIKMTGICRGSQLINVLSGGRMMHHIDGHGAMNGHTMSSYKNDAVVTVTSTHHQMSVIGPKGHLIAWSTDKRSDVYIGREDRHEDYTGPEVESFVYPETLCFGVQYHPEYMPKDSGGYKWYWQAVSDFLELPMQKFLATYTGAENASSEAAT